MLFLLFFLSGAAALVYEVAWTRSLGLVFGASHLAVTTVLAVYMGGQALGSALLGERSDRSDRPLRLHGLLEIGVGLSAVVFLGLMKIYPHLYGPLARVAEGNGLYLTFLLVVFAVVATLFPTTLMGGTLPTVARFAVGRRGGGLARFSTHDIRAVVRTFSESFRHAPPPHLSGKYEQLEEEARRYVDDTLRELRAAAGAASPASGGGADEAVVEAALRGATDRVAGHLSR